VTLALTPVPINMVPVFWPALVDELDRIAVRCDEPWRAGNVLAAIGRDEATLCIAYDGGVSIGFMIYQIAATDYSRDLHIWIAGGGTLERMREFWPLIREIAVARNCGAITLESPRRWERALNFLQVRYLYREGMSDVGQ
jgi:hypothetical protein